MTDFELSELEDLDEGELRHRFDRGDYVAQDDIKRVKRLLKNHEKERKFLQSCERASFSSALVAQKRSRNANLLAGLAPIISIACLVWQISSAAGQP